jgi:FdhE protein
MAQRILEPGQIESLAKASIPRIRLPDREKLFARRAARIRKLSVGATIGDYLQFLAVLVDAQHAALRRLTADLPTTTQIETSNSHGMPPIHASTWKRSQQWRETLEYLCEMLAGQKGFPAEVRENVSRLRRARSAWIDDQATSLLDVQNDAVDAAVAPIIMAALQVHWAALASQFSADEVKALDVPGVCPLCGMLPVASVVCAHSPFQGYRYLHCTLCASEWHMVRVQCSSCGAAGKDIGYHSLKSNTTAENPNAEGTAAVRAESCEQCRGYRKIMYQEHDTGVDPIADDLASLALDLLLGEQGYHRASGNPLLWMPSVTAAS